MGEPIWCNIAIATPATWVDQGSLDGDDPPGDAWRLLVEHGPSAAVNSYDDIDKGERAYQFRTTVYYEPND